MKTILIQKNTDYTNFMWEVKIAHHDHKFTTADTIIFIDATTIEIGYGNDRSGYAILYYDNKKATLVDIANALLGLDIYE